jgi:hypothetical protein
MLVATVASVLMGAYNMALPDKGTEEAVRHLPSISLSRRLLT